MRVSSVIMKSGYHENIELQRNSRNSTGRHYYALMKAKNFHSSLIELSDDSVAVQVDKRINAVGHS